MLCNLTGTTGCGFCVEFISLEAGARWNCGGLGNPLAISYRRVFPHCGCRCPVRVISAVAVYSTPSSSSIFVNHLLHPSSSSTATPLSNSTATNGFPRPSSSRCAQLPDLDIIARSYQSIATEMPKFRNVPAFDQGAEILNLMRRIEEKIVRMDEKIGRMDEKIDRFDSRFKAMCVALPSSYN